MKDEAKGWFEDAQRVLKSAKNNFRLRDYNLASRLSQEVAEKALKAFLIEREGILIKIHDLVLLGQRALLPAELLELCKELTPAHIRGKYPDAEGSWKTYEREEAAGDIKRAEEILVWIRKALLSKS